ncbi:FeoA domain-containing protein [Fusobacterium sp.]|uniref:FeoA domain-containing protein n=1 Tax=Fusobacterium sp. TaxID=68766 RepID=UPI0025BD93A5|nr:FeoA domain-containing protein [Fusobacterium sp.]
MVPLCFAPLGKDFLIKEIKGQKGAKCCLVDKGLCIGNKVRVMNGNGGCFVIKVNDTIKYALNFSLANKILLQEI